MRSRREGGGGAYGDRLLNLSLEPSRGESGLTKLKGEGAPNLGHFVIA